MSEDARKAAEKAEQERKAAELAQKMADLRANAELVQLNEHKKEKDKK